MTTHTVTEAVEAEPSESYDPLAALTIDELNTGSRHLKASLVHAITSHTQDYEHALAILLWLHRRRTERGALLTDVLALSFTAVTDELSGLTGEAGPTAPGRSPG